MRRILIFLIVLILLVSLILIGQLLLGSPPFQPPTINSDTVSNLQFTQGLGQGSMNNALAFSPVDDRIVVGGRRGIYLYDNIDAEPQFIALFREDGVAMNVTSVLWSADGNLIYAGSDDEYFTEQINESSSERVLVDHEEIIAYDVREGTIVYRLEGNTAHTISNDGLMLAYEMEIGFDVADVRTGEVLYEIRGPENVKGTVFPPTDDFTRWRVSDVQFTSDGTQLYIDFRLQRADLFNHFQLMYHLGSDFLPEYMVDVSELHFEYYRQSYGYASDGSLYTLYNQEIITLTQSHEMLSAGQTFISTSLHANFAPTSTPDRRIIAVPYMYRDDIVTYDNTSLIGVVIWDIEAASILGIIEQPEAWHVSAYLQDASLQLSRNATYLAVGTDIYDVSSGELVRRLYADEYSLLTGSQNHLLHYTYDNQIHLLETPSLRQISTLSIPRNEVLEIDLLENGNLRVSRKYDEQNQYAIHHISSATGESLDAIQFEFIDNTQFYDPRLYNGQRYIFNGNSAYVVTLGEVWRLWDIEQGAEIELPDNTSIVEPYFTPDGAVILRHEEENEIWLYDPASSDNISVPIPEYFQDSVSEYRFSDDGRIMAISAALNEDDRQITVWDVRSAPPQLLLEASTIERASGIAVSHDGVYVAFLNTDRVLEIYEIESGELFNSNNEGRWNNGGDLIFAGTELLIDPVWQGPQNWIVYDTINDEILGTYPQWEYPEATLLLDVGDLMFYRQNRTTLQITASDGLILHEVDLGRRFTSVMLSENRQQLWIDFTDGTVELWTLE